MSSTTELRLKQTFLAQSKKSVFRYGSKTNFFSWQDEQRRASGQSGFARVTDHVYSRLRRGDAVPREAMMTFSAFLKESGFKPWAMDKIAEDAPVSEEEDGRGSDAFGMTWLEHVSTALLQPINVDRLLPEIDLNRSFCQDRADCLRGAEIVMKSIARQDGNGTGLSDEAAISHGERMMLRSKFEYATWLETAASVNPNSVMFALDSRNGKPDRIGFSALVALTDHAYDGFRDGKLEDSKLRKADLLPRSKSVFLNALFESDKINLKEGRGRRRRILMKTLFTQLALVSAPLDLDDTEMRIVSLEGTKKAEERFRSAEYERVGTTTPQSRKQVVECAYPNGSVFGNPRKVLDHFCMRLLICCYQQAIAIRDGSMPK